MNDTEKIAVIKRAYSELLDRKPDKKGLNFYFEYWDLMIFDEVSLRNEIMHSNEFKNKQILKQQFHDCVSSLFQ